MHSGQPPFTTNPILLKNLLAQVGQGALQLPDFQRRWVWDDDRIKGLIASISKGLPDRDQLQPGTADQHDDAQQRRLQGHVRT